MRDIEFLHLMSPDMIKHNPWVLRETGANARNGRKKARNAREKKKKVYHLALLFLTVVTVVTCHAFLKTISWTEGTAMGSCARGGTFPFVPWEFFHRTFHFMYIVFVSFPFYLDPGAQVTFKCSWCVRACVCVLCVVTVMPAYCILKVLHEDSFHVRNQLIWCCAKTAL